MAPTKTQYVSIPLEEYKELLLRDKPTDLDHEVLERIMDQIEQSLEYSDDKYGRYSTYDRCDGLGAKHADKLVAGILEMLKIVDIERYMQLWNAVRTGERNRKSMEEMVAQMNQAKEIRQEAAR